MTEAGPVLAAVGKTSQKHPGLRVIVREPSTAALGGMRIARLSESLRQNGVAEGRLVLPAVTPATSPAADLAVAAAATPNADAGPSAATSAIPAGAAPAARADGAAPRYELAFAP
jgi:hypothetical protein